MSLTYYDEAFPILRDFLAYHESIKAHAPKTVQEYFLDLRMFFRYLKQIREPSLRKEEFEEIDIRDIDLEFLRSVSVSDILGFLSFLSQQRSGLDKTRSNDQSHHGLTAKSKARKQSSIRTFFNYLTKTMRLLESNPALSIDTPKQKKTLPHYLEEADCNRLLDAVSGPFAARDYCILLLFLSCGLRISELVGLNISDMMEESLRIRGKGSKERVVFLSDACQEAIDDYLLTRDADAVVDEDKDALFISRNRRRLGVRGVQNMVDKTLLRAGLDLKRYSPHKLRHTAATLMLRNGVDVKTLQEVLGHENLNTTQIYTHVDNEGLRIAAKAHPLSQRKKKE